MQMDFGAHFILSIYANLIYKRKNVLFWVRYASRFFLFYSTNYRDD